MYVIICTRGTMPIISKTMTGMKRIKTFPFMSVLMQELTKSLILTVQDITGSGLVRDDRETIFSLYFISF